MNRRLCVNELSFIPWGISSVWQSTSLARKGSSVQFRYAPLLGSSTGCSVVWLTRLFWGQEIGRSNRPIRTNHHYKPCPSDVIGSRNGLKHRCPKGRAGSSPASGTTPGAVDELEESPPFQGGLFAGSSPVGAATMHGSVAQLAEATRLGRVKCGFKSRPTHYNS